MKHYDFLIIGTGAGNIVLDAALDAGLRCAQIEKGKFGGTCLTRGCIPTKTLITPVDMKRDLEALKRTGVIKGDIEIDWTALGKRMWDKINESKDILEEYREEDNLDVYQGTGFFTEDKVLRVEYDDGTLSEPMTADTIVIAAGARTRTLDIENLEDVGYITSETFFGDKFPERPYKSLAIIGGGVIAAEFAHLFNGLGTDVTIIQRNCRLVPRMDIEIAQTLGKSFAAAGIRTEFNKDTVRVERDGDEKVLIAVDHITGEESRYRAEEILLAPGVVSNADTLKLDNTSITVNDADYIVTNEYLETSVDGVYAMGDINGRHQLRHVANYEAEALAYNLTEAKDGGRRKAVRYDIVPAAIFTYPQIGSVGMTEEQARLSDDVKQPGVGYFYYGHTAKAFAMGIKPDDEDHYAKVIADLDDNRILGAHIIGPEASVLIQPYVNLLNTGHFEQPVIAPEIGSERTARERRERERFIEPNTLDAVNDTMVIHPALSEVAVWAASAVEPVDEADARSHEEIYC